MAEPSASFELPQRHSEAERLSAFLRGVTGVEPVLWGASIVGSDAENQDVLRGTSTGGPVSRL